MKRPYVKDGKWLVFTDDPGIPKVPRLIVAPVDGSESQPREVATNASFAGWAPDGRSLLFSRKRDNAHDLYLLPFADGRAGGEARQILTLPAFFSSPLGVTANGSLILATSRDTADAMVVPIEANTATLGEPSAPQPVVGVDGRYATSLGPRFSPDGRKISYVTEPKTVLIRSLTDGSERTTLVQLARLERIEWAPDGGSLFAIGVNATGVRGIYQADLNTGAVALVTPAANPRGLAFTPEGGTLFYRKEPGVVARDLKSGVERMVAEFAINPNPHPLDLRVSHDGRRLAAIQQNNLWIIDIATGQIQRRIARGGEPNSSYRGVAWSAGDAHLLTIESNWRTPITELVSYPMDGVEPVRRATKNYQGLWLSPDGKQAVTMRRQWHQQIWVLENFLPPAAGPK